MIVVNSLSQAEPLLSTPGETGLCRSMAAITNLSKPGEPPAALMAIPTPGGIAELIWYVLAALSRERRWLAWIAPPQRPTKAALFARGVNPAHVLIIHPRPGTDSLSLVERVLTTGVCSAVLAWSAAVEEEQLARVQQAATCGHALGILFPPTSPFLLGP